MEEQEAYCVKFVFVEDGRERETSWIGPASSKEAAEQTARKWFGFEEDGIEVLSCEVS